MAPNIDNEINYIILKLPIKLEKKVLSTNYNVTRFWGEGTSNMSCIPRCRFNVLKLHLQ